MRKFNCPIQTMKSEEGQQVKICMAEWQLLSWVQCFTMKKLFFLEKLMKKISFYAYSLLGFKSNLKCFYGEPFRNLRNQSMFPRGQLAEFKFNLRLGKQFQWHPFGWCGSKCYVKRNKTLSNYSNWNLLKCFFELLCNSTENVNAVRHNGVHDIKDYWRQLTWLAMCYT